MKPLYDKLKESGSLFELKKLERQAIDKLNQSISTAPTLGLPDYVKPFELFVSERKGVALEMLVQTLWSTRRPISYFCKQIYIVS